MPSKNPLDYQATAQYSPTLKLWIGSLWDGEHLHTFEPRRTRDRALQDAWQHRERILNPQEATQLWTRNT